MIQRVSRPRGRVQYRLAGPLARQPGSADHPLPPQEDHGSELHDIYESCGMLKDLSGKLCG